MRRRNPLGQFQLNRLLLVALIAVALFLVWDRWQTARRMRDPKHLAQLANSLERDSDAARYAQMMLETRALAKQEFLELQAMTKKAQETLEKLQPSVARLHALLEQLRTTSKGKGIAADRSSLEQFHAATAEFSVTPESVAEYRQSLDILGGPIEAAIGGQSFDKPPEPEFRAKVQALCEGVARDEALVAETEKKVQAILAAAPSSESGALMLAEALEQLEREWAALDAATERNAREAVRAENRERLAAERTEQERATLQAERENKRKVHEEQLRADQLAAEAEARRIAEAAEEAKREEERRIAEREYRTALPEIEKYLSAFITPGHQQFTRGKWVYTEEKKPLSYSALKGYHALRLDQTGQMYFATHAATKNNDRPGGPFSGYLGGQVPPEMVPDIVKAQNLMIKYADKLIEDGKLLP